MTKKKEVLEPTTQKMAPKKPIAKKTAAKQKAIVNTMADLNSVELESYSIEMTIPTGQYANIRPRITVKAYSMDKAHDFMAPHMNKLWKEYYLVNERRPEPVAPKQAAPVASPVSSTTPEHLVLNVVTPAHLATAPAPATPTYLNDPKPVTVDTRPLTVDEICKATGGKKIEDMTVDEIFPSPASSVAYGKATQAIESCMSLDALEIIRSQVDKSVKLTQEDKEKLQPLLVERFQKLSDGF